MVNLITEHIDIWTSAQIQKANGGRGRGKNSNGQSPHGIKKLRELILELAVRGKLVPQHPNDGPASELLEKIAEEKACLIKEGKIKKQKPLPEISEEGKPYELPNGWGRAFIPQVVINDTYAIKRGPFGSSIKKDFFVPSGFKVYEQQHAINDDFSLGEYYIDEEKFNELRAFEVKPNDLIISCSGTVGKVAIAPSWMEPGIINQALLKLSLNQNALINDYFKILFPAFYMKTETLSDLQGTAQKNMVSVSDLKKIPFPLPPLAEQHRIVAKVDELMVLCDQLEQQQTDSNATHQTLVETLLATLTNAADQKESAKAWQRIAKHFDTLFTTEQSIDQLKQTILQLAVVGKLVTQDPNDESASDLLEKIAKEKARLIKEGKIKKQKPLPEISEDEKPFELPQGWEWVRLQEIVRISSGDGLTAANMNNKGNIPVFGGNGITGYHDQTNVSKPTLVIGRVGYYCGSVHITPASAWVTDNAFKTTFSEENIYINFLYWLLKGTNLKENENATAQPVISGRKVYPIVVGLPPTDEQHRIVAKVDELMAFCDTLKTRLNDAQTTQVQLADAIVEQAMA